MVSLQAWEGGDEPHLRHLPQERHTHQVSSFPPVARTPHRCFVFDAFDQLPIEMRSATLRVDLSLSHVPKTAGWVSLARVKGADWGGGGTGVWLTGYV